VATGSLFLSARAGMRGTEALPDSLVLNLNVSSGQPSTWKFTREKMLN
jgi:hypothetical protein